MSSEGRFWLNEEIATGKVIEDEAILINVVTGRYYSLCDATCIAWQVLSRGGSAAEAVEAICARYDVVPEVAQREVNGLISDLLDEQLLVRTERNGGHWESDLQSPDDGSRLPYDTIRLQTFRDMEDLLAFDPPLPQVPEQFIQHSAD